ncbi:hypothetical protein BDW74DRAFT_169103 [Aspergillus multicolor]|uniref:cytochrome P450 n=1 Tax=Aspergillus multicolor TaxID=41759 RepID=UPI003CCE3F15
MSFVNNFEGQRASSPVLKLFAVIFLIILILKVRARHVTRRITNKHGKRICEVPGDARVSKFAFSQQLSEQGKTLAGDEPFIIRNGRARELVVTKPEHIYDFYKGDTKRGAVGVHAGERWTVMRRYFDPEFSFQSARGAIPKLTAGIDSWLNGLPKLGTQTDNGFAMDIKKPCRFLPFRLVAEFIYGEVFDDKLFAALLELNTLHEAILHDVIANKRLTTKLGSWMNRQAAGQMKVFQSRWKGFNLDIIQTAREASAVCPAERIYRGVEKGELKLDEFLHTLDEILFANVDVSSAVLSTMLQHLASDPAFQQKFREEIQEQNQDGTRTYDTDVELEKDSWKYLSKAETLLNFAIMESMRLSPAFAFSLPECTAVPKEIGGYQVPARCPVVIDAKRLNADPETWGKDGNQFRPERFRDIPAAKRRYGFMRFGVGAASGRCLGKHVADTLFKLTVMEVLQRYSLHSFNDGLEVEMRAITI